MALKLYNTLTRQKTEFVPIDPKNVRMYVCGPTVYDFAHIGNARPVIVFDVLFRLLRHIFGPDHVTYVRNITDVDDKINARAARDYPDLPLNDAIRKVTEATERQFHKDIGALGVLPPTYEPRATEYIRRPGGGEDMISMIETLVRNGHAYVVEDHVLFDVASMPDYGRLSNRSLDEMEAGARVEVAPYKKGPMDFVLWKPSKPGEPAWPSPAGIATPGRPGWHIECSAMAGALLGPVFDIHGGGIDLTFPHHENEIAQSRCAHSTSVMANVWMHNGFLQVEGEKMSKSLGNFVTINELLRTDKFGGRRWSGPVLRLAMLMTHYREPIDFNLKRLEEAEFILNRIRLTVDDRTRRSSNPGLDRDLAQRLFDDLDTPGLINLINSVCKSEPTDPSVVYTLYKWSRLIGFSFIPSKTSRLAAQAVQLAAGLERLGADGLSEANRLATKSPHFKSGKLRPEYYLLTALNLISQLSKQAFSTPNSIDVKRTLKKATEITVDPKPKKLLSFKEFIKAEAVSLKDSVTKERENERHVAALVAARLEARKRKDFKESDRIRDELASMGITLKDTKNKETGEIETTWEVAR